MREGDIQSLVRNNIERNAVATLQSMKPVMSKELEVSVLSAVAQYKDRNKWREWGMAHYRSQGSCILMHGPPGTGKTVIAEWLFKNAKLGHVQLDMATFGSGTPGDNERNIAKFFAEAKRDGKGVFIDECDGILWDRGMAGQDSQWMVPVINKILTEIANFPDLMVLATNRLGVLDKALQRRILSVISVPRPEFAERIALWQQKIPKKYPFQPTTVQVQELASYGLTGAEIENVVFVEAQESIVLKHKPSFKGLMEKAAAEAKRHIEQ